MSREAHILQSREILSKVKKNTKKTIITRGFFILNLFNNFIYFSSAELKAQVSIF